MYKWENMKSSHQRTSTRLPPRITSQPCLQRLRAHFCGIKRFTLIFEEDKPFSRSSGLSLGVGGISSTLVRPLLDRLGARPSLTELGNSERRGVRAVTTLRADLRIVSRTFHSLFLAM